jgi:hypothetical protein
LEDPWVVDDPSQLLATVQRMLDQMNR